MNLSFFNAILAQGTAPAAGAAGTQTTPNPTGQLLQTVVMFGGIFAIFYLLMIRPQSKKAKELAAKLNSLKPGDKVVTSSGIVGTVVAIKDRTLSLRSAETKLEVLKSAVADITERAGETSSAE
jgi:preprotein translocase subunit YajC